MARPMRLAFGSLAVAILGWAGAQGCASDEEPSCQADTDCVSATTPCTVGVCRESKCVAQPVADGTRLKDQPPIAEKPCILLRCKAGKVEETADGSRTPDFIECKKHICEGTTLTTVNILDGVACAGGGACRGGVCLPPADSGPGDTGSTDTGGDDTGSTDGASD
ncbi:MAG: hypothetical protein HYV09_03975 [Deltaproteobacteria bacterium]|nr:hypothetical protein [Deltaproteobacteria bacterium]